MRVLFAAVLMTLVTLAVATDADAQAKTDCSKYTGVEKEACEKMASKKR